MLGEILYHIAVFARIGFVESRICLVEDDERRRIDLDMAKSKAIDVKALSPPESIMRPLTFFRGKLTFTSRPSGPSSSSHLYHSDPFVDSDYLLHRKGYLRVHRVALLPALRLLDHSELRLSSAEHQSEIFLELGIYLEYAALELNVYSHVELRNKLAQFLAGFFQIG